MLKNRISMKLQEKILLAVILCVACILRLYHLTYQSLWLDELHTLIEADPKLKISELFDYLRCCDQHPPLFFLLERAMFAVFGHTDFVARLLSAIAGTLRLKDKASRAGIMPTKRPSKLLWRYLVI